MELNSHTPLKARSICRSEKLITFPHFLRKKILREDSRHDRGKLANLDLAEFDGIYFHNN